MDHPRFRVVVARLAAAMVLALVAMSPRPAGAQNCGNWLPGPSAPDFGLYGSVMALGASNAELYAMATIDAGGAMPRVFVQRMGTWQALPWDDASQGRILLFTTDGGQPATLSARTVSSNASTRTVEYAIRTYNGASWVMAASMQQTIGLTAALLNFGDMTLYNGSWYVGTVGGGTGSLYRSSGAALTLLATTDATSCTPILTACIYLDPRSFLALQVGIDGLYIGGRFNSVTPSGGAAVAATNLVRYNGTQFTALAAQPNGRVRGMLLDDSIQFNNIGLVVWGEFSQVGALAAASIARWNSFTGAWNALGAGLNGSPASVVQVAGAQLNTINYVAVGGYPVGVANTFGCAKWASGTWTNYGGDTVETSLAGVVNAKCAINFSGVIAGGSGLSVNNASRYGVARWSGASWDYVASQKGTDGASRAATVHNSSVYVGGDFTRIDSVIAAHVARRNPTTNVYEPLGTGVDGPVFALASFGGELIAGGTFGTAGGTSASNVAAWNSVTSSWRALGAGLDGTVRGFTVWNGSLVAVGSFRNSGATATGSAARWTGAAWVAVDATFNTADLYAAATLGSTLHVGGPTGFRRFNGTSFEVVGGNVAGTVYSLFSLLSSVYVGGDFASVGSPSQGLERIARWSGTAWFAVGPNGVGDFISGSVRTIFGSAAEIIAGGDFQTTASSVATLNIARYDGVQWRRLDTDYPSARVLGGVVLGDRVWAVGEFTYTGVSTPIESFGVGQWAKAPVFIVGPTAQRVCQTDGSGSAVFSVQTFGTPAPSLRWRFNTVPMNDNLRISGSATPTLMIAAVTGADAGNYDCVATDTCANTTSSASAALAVGGCCVADFNGNGTVEVQDIFDFLNGWLASDPHADVNGGGLDVQDIFDFLNAWLAGC